MSEPVVVVGGGPAGLFTALHLRRRGHEVRVLERSRYDDVRVGEHLAAWALDPLRRAGLAELAEPPVARITPGTSAAWGSEHLEHRSDILDPWGAGRTVARPAFDVALAQRVRAEGVQVETGVAVRTLVRSDRGWEVSTDAGETWASFVVDATGRSTRMAERLGASRLVYDELVGVAVRCTPGHASAEVWVEAAPWGWWYSALLPDGALMVVHFTEAADLQGVDVAGLWRARLQQTSHTRARIDHARGLGRPVVRSARSQRLSRAAGRGWIAVGDAAAAWDPLSASGLPRALESGESAAAAVDAAQRGDATGLDAYATAVQAEVARYLRTRAEYYRRESRFVEVPFWSHRRRPVPIERPLALAPSQPLVPADPEAPIPEALVPEALPPGLTVRTVMAAVGARATAAEVVERLHEATAGGYLGEELIVALQELVAAGLLQRA